MNSDDLDGFDKVIHLPGVSELIALQLSLITLKFLELSDFMCMV